MSSRHTVGLSITLVLICVGLFIPRLARGDTCVHMLLGLHGMGEGPIVSSTIEATKDSFEARANALDVTNWGFAQVEYPTTPAGGIVYTDEGEQRSVWGDVKKGEEALDGLINYYSSLCSSSTYTLAGYSEGAWVIDWWLNDHRDKWPQIKGVELYGDPNWYRRGTDSPERHKPIYSGLVRLFNVVPVPPYPIPGTEKWLQTLCIPMDPICGEGFPAALFSNGAQVAAARACIADCLHLHYIGAATKQGGEFLANQAFG